MGLLDTAEQLDYYGKRPDKGNYFKSSMGQQDQYVDNRESLGQVAYSGNYMVDQLDKMAVEQGLVDNTLDFIPGTRLGQVARAGSEASRATGRAIGISERIGIPIGDALKDTFRGKGSKLSNAVLGGNKKVRTSPTYREVDGYKDKRSLGVNYGGDKDNVSNIYVKKDGRSKSSVASTKRHEYDHDRWFKKYGDSKQGNVVMTRGTSDDLVKSADWSGKPWEINAQARQVQHVLGRLKKQKSGKYNTEDVEHLEDLVQNSLPFADNFIKQYPSELGDYIMKGADFLDNMKIRSMK